MFGFDKRLIAGSIILIILAVIGTVLLSFSEKTALFSEMNHQNSMNTTSHSPETIDALIQAGKTEEAKRVLIEAVSDPSTDPFSLYSYCGSLYVLGNREQAAFVFYLAQVRTRTAAKLDPDPSGSPALRGALNDALGGLINPWVGSDVESWKRIAFGATAYDKTLGYPQPRFGVTKEDWERTVSAEREAYEADMESFLTPLNQETHAAQRIEAGLYAGPLENPGDPLPAQWGIASSGGQRHTENDGVGAYLEMAANVPEYQQLAKQTVTELAKGNGDFLKDNLSTTLVASNAPEDLDSFVSAALDLFANFQRLEESVTIQPSTDSAGNTGYSFAMKSINTDGTETFFKIYVVQENGILAVANITQ